MPRKKKPKTDSSVLGQASSLSFFVHRDRENPSKITALLMVEPLPGRDFGKEFKDQADAIDLAVKLANVKYFAAPVLWGLMKKAGWKFTVTVGPPIVES